MKKAEDINPSTSVAQSREIMFRYVSALGVMTTFGSMDDHPRAGDDPTVAFLPGPIIPPEMRAHFVESVKEKQFDFVCIQFEQGKVRGGPRNITVFERRDGDVLTWAKCTLWWTGYEDFYIIVPQGQDFGFRYNGFDLKRVPGVPTSNLGAGIVRAKEELRKMAKRVPPSMLEQFNTRVN